MSKYTSEIRFICESVTGHSQSVGFNDVKNVLSDAAPIIFDFDYPIFDENYRIPLETKILRHYYTREISEETYGLWKLRLEDRMNVIMPYYNQLYESALIKFDPFRDVDLTTTHTGSASGVVNESGNSNESRENQRKGSVDETVNENSVKSGMTESDKIENASNNVNESNSENFNKIGSNQGGETNNETAGTTHTGTVEDKMNRQHSLSNFVNENGESKENKNDSKSEQYSGNSNQNNVNTTNGNREGKSDNLQWDLFSDTPQGGIDGLNVPNSSAPSASLENNLYLTTARKITNEDKSKESTDNVSIGNNHGEQSSNTTQTDILNGTVTNVNSKNGIESGSGEEIGVKTYNEGNSETKSGSKNTNSMYNETNSGNVNKNRSELGEKGVNETENYSESNNNFGSKGINEENTENEVINRGNTGSKVSTNTDEYLQNIAGKSGGMSYSAMLLEFRETFINIDEMIIEELTDLFFGLW